MKVTLREEIDGIEELVRAGQVQWARAKILRMQKGRLQRDHSLKLANLARRLQMFRTAMGFINPICRPGSKFSGASTPEELLEYAIILLRCGARGQSLKILEQIDEKNYPLKWLYKANAFIADWDYAKAAAELKLLLKAGAPTEYLELVAMVNLAAAYVFVNQGPEAHELLKEILAKAKKLEAHLLYANGLEISAQLALQEQNWLLAEAFLREAEGLVGGTSFYRGTLQIQKWRAIKDSLQSGEVAKALNDVREAGQKTQNWEIARDCDFYAGLIGKNPALLEHVYFGTLNSD